MKSPHWLFGGLLVLLFLVPPAFANPSPYNGLAVTRIDIKDDLGRPWAAPDQIMPLIGLKPGDAFADAAVREGISLLYLKGMFKDILVEAFPDEGGVRMEYVLIPVTIVEKVVVSGNAALSTQSITDGLPHLEGKELHEEKLPAIRSDLIALYETEGFYDPIIAFRIETLADRRRVALHIEVQEPAPMRIAEISFAGTTVFRDKDLRSVMKSSVNSRLRRDLLLDTDLEAIRKKYADAGYPAAKSGPVGMSFRDRNAYISVSVAEGPRVTVHFSGAAAINETTLRKSLLIWSEHDISNEVIESSADRIRTQYRELGYADATVEIKKTEGPRSLDIEFVIKEGPRVRVRKIVIRGNTVFSAGEIEKQMALREPGWFRSSPFRDDLLDKDADNLRDRYLEAGYLGATVRHAVERSADARTADVTIEVAEGARTMTGSVLFEGNTIFSDRELLDKLALRPGMPFNERLLDEDKYRILSAYSNKGFLYARVDAERNPRDTAIDVRYRITEDHQVTINRIILRGNVYTRDSIIMRELLVKPGDFYDYAAILGSQQRIYRLGYFRLAKFEPVSPGEREYSEDMLLSVDERPAGAVELGVGYGDLDRIRASVELSHRNLWGTARYTSLRFEESSILKRAIFNYKEPWLLNYDVDGKFSLIWSDSEKLNSDTREIYYNTRKTSAAFGIEKTYEHLKPSLTYMFENVRNYDVQQAAQLTPEDSGRVLVSSLNPALVWDLRDDVFNPRKGSLYGITLKEALRELGSQADFSKLTVQAGWFLPIESSVLACSARAGMAWPFRDTPEVPLHERFYVGGSTTVRGYNQDAIGPSALDANGDLIPQGGASMAILNIELRINPGEGLGYVLFTDAGNVWPGQEINLNTMRASYGVGIRYGTPIGPLRIDYGQKAHRQSGESPGEVHFNIGNTF